MLEQYKLSHNNPGQVIRTAYGTLEKLKQTDQEKLALSLAMPLTVFCREHNYNPRDLLSLCERYIRDLEDEGNKDLTAMKNFINYMNKGK